jgi:hypothetical protein
METTMTQIDLPVYAMLPFEVANVAGSRCANCGEQFSFSHFHNTDVKNRLMLSCTRCGDLALFDVLPD